MKGRIVVAAAFLGGALAWVAGPAAAEDKFRLRPGARGALCLECHSTFQDTMKRRAVHTPVKSGDCADCHNPHASSHGKLLAADAGGICQKCHAGLVPEGARSVHAPVLKDQCVACHDPHAADHPDVLKAAGNALCAGCHADVERAVAASRFKHDPAGKSCLSCHDPHASSRSAGLLKKEEPALCIGCHRIDQPAFAGRHMNYPVGKGRCTACHDPHGSDAGGLLLARVHAPVTNRMCNQCHNDPSSPEPLGLRRSGLELCRGCHVDVINEIAARDRVHWPALDGKACLNCHSPHASREPALLHRPAAPLCGSCHEETIAHLTAANVKHAPVTEGNCAACHAPHASDNVSLLKVSDTMELCGACHDWKQHSSHPIGPKVIDPRNPNLAVDCSSCHQAHGSPFTSFAHLDPEGALCVQCHQDIRR